MNTNYWSKFYKDFDEYSPSPFAKFCKMFIEDGATVIDIGCGNGRDTYWFANQGISVVGVDNANRPTMDNTTANFVRMDLNKIDNKHNVYDVVYARFLLHAVDDGLMNKIFKWAGNSMLMLEFRVEGDEPQLYPGHHRYLRNPSVVRLNLEKSYGMEILYYKVGRGLAPYKEENPLVCRIICRKPQS